MIYDFIILSIGLVGGYLLTKSGHADVFIQNFIIHAYENYKNTERERIAREQGYGIAKAISDFSKSWFIGGK